ncbi:hypothetical protein P171DRAFT_432070 [Karstenula rhodostoma CBS 690.94]|uniref:Uncharacterized protein n=1 Tax=Karstenula rhodostoma CBS 690.94 TaxID=1392251 RepID=A0A9P4PJC3_9PLEO|nr:hypothetical protein P171DRAFT_432070 [Karstenula rhodostoma CBS 690.94]
MASVHDVESADASPPRSPAESSISLPPRHSSFFDDGCGLCRLNSTKTLTIREILSASTRRCDWCEKMTMALSVYMAQQATHEDPSDHEEFFRPEDRVRMWRFGSFNWIMPFVSTSMSTRPTIEICLDRKTADIAETDVNTRDTGGGYLYKGSMYGLSVPWSTGSQLV